MLIYQASNFARPSYGAWIFPTMGGVARPSRMDAVRRIIQQECEGTRFTEADILSNRRAAPLVRVRHRIWKRVADELRPSNRAAYSYPAMARMFNRDHSTILHGIKMAEARNG